MSTEENKALVRRFIEEFDGGNLAVMDELIAPDALLHYPGGVDVRGPEGLKEFVAPFITALPDFQHIVEDLLADGEKVIARYTVRATHKGEFRGCAPTGKQVTWTSIGIYRIADGKFQEWWAEADFLGLMQQLGVVPADGDAVT